MYTGTYIHTYTHMRIAYVKLCWRCFGTEEGTFLDVIINDIKCLFHENNVNEFEKEAKLIRTYEVSFLLLKPHKICF